MCTLSLQVRKVSNLVPFPVIRYNSLSSQKSRNTQTKPKKKEKKISKHEPHLIWTDNLSIWSRTRYRCAAWKVSKDDSNFRGIEKFHTQRPIFLIFWSLISNIFMILFIWQNFDTIAMTSDHKTFGPDQLFLLYVCSQAAHQTLITLWNWCCSVKRGTGKMLCQWRLYRSCASSPGAGGGAFICKAVMQSSTC